ncbi:MAG: alanine--glyoxylate aminotransferase family protein [Chloroflexi bacterium]|nr:alanine--glyoxylate aminotransferase family protein [Chloroflexota bacterium]
MPPQLRIPGPTPCPDDVLKAMGRQMIDHRGKEFGEVMYRVTTSLKEMFQTKGDVFVLTTSGTGAMEASIVNTLSPGDKVLAVSIGSFGDRYADIAKAYGADVQCLNFEWGHQADPDAVRRVLKDVPAIKAVLFTHNETSTGVTNDLQSLAKVAREYDKLVLVDAISSLGSINLETDAWGCDVVCTGSQKGWMVPPGLAMVSVSQKAWQAYEKAKMPRYYFDFGKARKYLEKKQTPWTPAVSQFFALQVGLDDLAKEGMPNVMARHKRISKHARDSAKAIGLKLFPASETYASATVTAINGPDGVNVVKLLQVLRDEYKVVLAGGQGKLEGKIFRIGHLGLVTEKDMDEVAAALRSALPSVGLKAL